MIKHTSDKKRGAYERFLSVILLSLLIFGPFFTFPVKKAKAVNNYIEDIKFYDDTSIRDDNRKVTIMEFRVKTTFQIEYYERTQSSENKKECQVVKSDGTKIYQQFGRLNFYGDVIEKWTSKDQYMLPVEYNNPKKTICDQGIVTYQAGNKYKFILGNGVSYNSITKEPESIWASFPSYFPEGHNDYTTTGYRHILNNNDYITDAFKNLYDNGIIPFKETDTIYFSETPFLLISYPSENDEIAEAFTIQGTYSFPENNNYQYLTAFFREKGEPPFYLYSFDQELITNAGNVNIQVSGIPASEYDIFFFFRGGGEESYNTNVYVNNIKIVQNIPYLFPETEGETIPDIFSPISPEYVYDEYSNYATSTKLYTTLTGALKPIIATLGDNLTYFSSQFNQNKAKETGQNIGNAIVIVRTYAGNINSFFNNLPVSETLLLYLILLVAVAIFRIIRQAINLIPFT